MRVIALLLKGFLCIVLYYVLCIEISRLLVNVVASFL